MSTFEFLTSAALTVVGSGVGTAIVGAWYKRKIDQELEIQKAYLSRATRVHERQVEVLAKLYGHFSEVQAFLQLTQKAFSLANESTDEYPKRLISALHAAVRVLTFGRLLIPPDLAKQCDVVFDKVFESRQAYGFFLDPLLQDANERMKLHERATTVSHKEIPQLLYALELAMREIVYGSALAAH